MMRRNLDLVVFSLGSLTVDRRAALAGALPAFDATVPRLTAGGLAPLGLPLRRPAALTAGLAAAGLAAGALGALAAGLAGFLVAPAADGVLPFFADLAAALCFGVAAVAADFALAPARAGFVFAPATFAAGFFPGAAARLTGDLALVVALALADVRATAAVLLRALLAPRLRVVVVPGAGRLAALATVRPAGFPVTGLRAGRLPAAALRAGPAEARAGAAGLLLARLVALGAALAVDALAAPLPSGAERLPVGFLAAAGRRGVGSVLAARRVATGFCAALRPISFFGARAALPEVFLVPALAWGRAFAAARALGAGRAVVSVSGLRRAGATDLALAGRAGAALRTEAFFAAAPALLPALRVLPPVLATTASSSA